MHKSKSQLFQIRDTYTPRGDQPRAIEQLVTSIEHGEKKQVLLGVTGSGKTFTIANVIARLGLPTLILAHNKTLAAQLYEEFHTLFPDNAVEYFVSYYDYYQPEAYVPSTDTYIDKDSSINDNIDRMRHSATRSLFERNDVIIVSSVSCIYGLGSAEAYSGTLLFLETGETYKRDAILHQLIDIRYERNDIDFHRGTFRVRGDSMDIFPAHEASEAIRLSWFGDCLDSIDTIDPIRGKKLNKLDKIAIYPSSHYVVTPESKERAMAAIRSELQERIQTLRTENQLIEAQRIQERTMFDLEMLEQVGYCNGVENYSRHLTGRTAGDPPPTLVDYFPRHFLMVIDESHQTVPQLGAMYKGDRARKENLVRYGFRLPSALDNRPLRFEELQKIMDRVIYVSATPGDFELQETQGVVVEQIIRPTGLIDPKIHVRPVTNQVDDLLEEIRLCIAGLDKERVLITTLTKRMAEDLTDYYAEVGINVRYLHSDIDTLERIDILRDLRLGVFDVLVGINLLREGLDLPEVGLVAILDADKEGFLRSARALIQTIGRAARHINGRVILYADHITESMRIAMDETQRRREIQHAYNIEHGITPRSTQRSIQNITQTAKVVQSTTALAEALNIQDISHLDTHELLTHLQIEMQKAAENLEFERAATLRDAMKALQEELKNSNGL